MKFPTVLLLVAVLSIKEVLSLKCNECLTVTVDGKIDSEISKSCTEKTCDGPCVSRNAVLKNTGIDKTVEVKMSTCFEDNDLSDECERMEDLAGDLATSYTELDCNIETCKTELCNGGLAAEIPSLLLAGAAVLFTQLL